MGETIPFPHNYAGCLALAKDAKDKAQYEQALDYYEQALSYQQPLPVHQEVVNCLLALKRYSEARSYIKERPMEYLKDSVGLSLFIQVLVGEGRFMEARKQLYLANATQEDYLACLTMIQVGEDYANLYQKLELTSLVKEIQQQLSQSDLASQIKGINQAECLPSTWFIKELTPYLTARSVHPFVRKGLLEYWLFLSDQVAGDLVYLDYDQTEQVVALKDLNMIKDLEVTQELHRCLLEELTHVGEDMQKQLEAELFFFTTLLYPNPDLRIKNSQLFIQLFISRYLMLDSSLEGTTEETEEYEELITTLQNIWLGM